MGIRVTEAWLDRQVRALRGAELSLKHERDRIAMIVSVMLRRAEYSDRLPTTEELADEIDRWLDAPTIDGD